MLEIPDSRTTVQLWEEDSMWVIHHEPTGVTTQGETQLHALLMLADALSAFWDSDEDLLELAEDVFVMDDETKRFIDSMRES